MKNNIIKVVFAALLFFAASLPLELKAQQSNIMYGSSRNPLSNSMNPAFFPSHSKVYLSLPNVNFRLNSPLSYSDVFKYDSVGGNYFVDANMLLDSLSQNSIGMNALIHGVGLGFTTKKFFVTLSAQMKMDAALSLPSGIMSFLNEGNYGHTGSDYVELIDGDLVSTRLYAEAALGFGYNFTDNLTVGGRLKMLVGYLDLSNAGTSMRIYTAPDYSSLTTTLDLDMHLASFLDIQTDSGKISNVGIATLFPKNTGMTFDLGARYATDRFEVSASILDLGPGIHWKDNIQKVVSYRDDNSFTFSGVDFSPMFNGGEMDSTFMEMMKDSLMTLVNYKIISDDTSNIDYWTRIPTKVNISGMYHINKVFSAGLVFHGRFVRDQVLNSTKMASSTTVLARANLYDWAEFTIANSFFNNNGKSSLLNPGMGITFTPFKVLQLYMFMDYASSLYVIDTKDVSFSFGLNLLFGNSSRK